MRNTFYFTKTAPFICTNYLILESKENLILKFGQLIKYNVGKIKKNMHGLTSTIKSL